MFDPLDAVCEQKTNNLAMSADAAQNALLVMDSQTRIVEGAPESFFVAMRRAVDAAHEAGIQVIYIRVELRPGQAGVSPRNKLLSRIQPILQEGAPGLEIHRSLAPQERDIVLTKHRMSSFAGSGLDVVLSSLNVKHLVLGGVSTSTAVLGTAMAAADLDFALHVLGDACFDASADVHELLLKDVLPMWATVLSAAEWADAIST